MSTTHPNIIFQRNTRLQCQFNDYCHLTDKLLSSNPQGLTLPTVQMSVGLSAKTARRILALVATERDGKYYPRHKGESS